jgi:hypothetical protein
LRDKKWFKTMGEPEKKPLVSTSTADVQPKKRSNRRRHHGNNGSKTTVPAVKFHGGKEELNGNYSDCTRYEQSDRFTKTVQKVADYIGQEYKGGGVTQNIRVVVSHGPR